MTRLADNSHASTGQCIEICLDCYRACLQTSVHCADIARPAHLRLLQDCATACRTAADFMLRGSEFAAALCAPCAEICNACAAACENFTDDAKMKGCADVCRRCAEACRK